MRSVQVLILLFIISSILLFIYQVFSFIISIFLYEAFSFIISIFLYEAFSFIIIF